LYGPNDNFDLEKSHVLPALIRKIHLGKAIESNDWSLIKKDLNSLPIEGVNGNAKQEEILLVLKKYGIRSDDGQVKIEIWGSGKPKREFLWSEDMADACVFLMENRDFKDTVAASDEKRTSNKEIRNTHINIGTGKDISIAQLATIIKDEIGFNGELYYNSEKPDGTMKKLTDTTKLHNLGWHHTIDLPLGIKQMYEWYIGH
ncbi:MAG: NAD-dependent epimerase/dehydratase family protein, partial [Leeuwenhoekiella sp.]